MEARTVVSSDVLDDQGERRGVSSGVFDVEARTAISSDVFDDQGERRGVSSDVFDDQGERRGVRSDVFDDQGERRGVSSEIFTCRFPRRNAIHSTNGQLPVVYRHARTFTNVYGQYVGSFSIVQT